MKSENWLIEGIQVRAEGEGDEVVLMLHGWPDSAELWDSTVQALRGSHRCVRLTLPGFELHSPARPTSLDAMCALLEQIIQTVSPERPVTLLIHDWGCVFGYEFAARHPQRVRRIAAVDIGDHNNGRYLRSLAWRERMGIFSYQLWLALAWWIGLRVSTALGNRMTRAKARGVHCPAPSGGIGWQMNYPYAMQWFGAYGGFRNAHRVEVHCPTLFVYGTRKPFMFHSEAWLQSLRSTPGCAALGLKSGHWVMLDQPEPFHAALRDWLQSG